MLNAFDSNSNIHRLDSRHRNRTSWNDHRNSRNIKHDRNRIDNKNKNKNKSHLWRLIDKLITNLSNIFIVLHESILLGHNPLNVDSMLDTNNNL